MPGGVGGARSTMTGPYPDSGVRRASDSSVDSSFGCGQLRSPAGKSHRRRRRRWSPKRSEQGVARRLFASTEGTVRGLVVSLHGRRHFQHPDGIAFAQYAPIVLAGDGAAVAAHWQRSCASPVAACRNGPQRFPSPGYWSHAGVPLGTSMATGSALPGSFSRLTSSQSAPCPAASTAVAEASNGTRKRLVACSIRAATLTISPSTVNSSRSSSPTTPQ